MQWRCHGSRLVRANIFSDHFSLAAFVALFLAHHLTLSHLFVLPSAFQYIISNKGITTEAAYPYTAQQGTCKSGLTTAATITSFVDVTAGSETALLAAVNIGPVSIAIEADQQCFQFYAGGILSDPSCGTQLDHGVLVVGYGTENGVDFWIVKNSWGATWSVSI
jgi:C1A family cysteine protease